MLRFLEVPLPDNLLSILNWLNGWLLLIGILFVLKVIHFADAWLLLLYEWYMLEVNILFKFLFLDNCFIFWIGVTFIYDVLGISLNLIALSFLLLLVIGFIK